MDFEKLYDFLPKTTEKWSIDDVALWLNFIGLGSFSDKFKQTAIDGASILLLENDDLVNDLQIASSMIRKKILNWTKFGLKEYSSFILQKQKILREIQGNNKENMNMQIENPIFEIPLKKEKEFLKKPSNNFEEFPLNENTNPISNPSKFLANDHMNIIELDHLATNNLQMNNNIIMGQNLYQEKPQGPSPFNNQNPFINALTAEPLEFNNNFFSNQNYIPSPFMYMENGNGQNPMAPLSRAEKVIIPNAFQRFRTNSTHNNAQTEMLDENESLTCKSNQGKPIPKFEIENKENIQNIPNATADNELIIQPTEGAQTTFYCIKDSGGKIGRHSSNQMVILEESVSRYHAEILFKNKDFYIRDIGSTTGTFLKITANIFLEVGMIIEMGSNQFMIEKMVCANNAGDLQMTICEGPNLGQKLVVSLKDQLTSNSIGRKNTNTFPFPEDQHLSNIHAKFFILDNKFYLEDLSSTNGSWRRLSREGETSPIFLLNDQTVFKIGTTSTFIVNKQVSGNAVRKIEVEGSKGDCIICCENERDALYLPCKHNTACVKCSKNLRECPICKLKIEDIIKIYRA